MTVRLIKAISEEAFSDKLVNAARALGALDSWRQSDESGKFFILSLLSPANLAQDLIALIQTHLGKETRIVIQSVEVTIPRVEEEVKIEEADVRQPFVSSLFKQSSVSREELYDEVEAGSRLSVHFILMVILATLVACMGVLYRNYVILIGAMLIAPLLGPNLGLAFGTAIGDFKLIRGSIKSNVIGFVIAVLFSYLIGLIWFDGLHHPHFTEHLHVGFDSMILAIASGVAAVVAMLSDVPSGLVGVMVAVALLPPIAEIGLGLSIGYGDFALHSFLLLVVNVICTILAGNIMFIIAGVRPSFWEEKQIAKRASRILISSLFIMLLVLIALFYFHFSLVS